MDLALFFGMADCHNDINVLQYSLVFVRLVDGQAPECNYVVNGHQYNKGYYLAAVAELRRGRTGARPTQDFF